MLNIVLTLFLAAVPLVDAIKSGDTAAALALLQQKVNVNMAEPDGTTALHWAVERENPDLVERLIKAGANVNAKNDYGATPMSEAALSGNVKIMEKLLDAGADVEAANSDGQTALMIVARTSNVEAVRLLLRHAANVNAVEKWREQTALMWAAAEKQPAMVKELVTHGANVNAQSNVNNFDRQVTAEPRAIYRPAGGLTALHFAAREGCLECTRTLAEAGADLNASDPDNVSPLLTSVLNGHFDLAAYLINKGGNPDKWDWWGQSPLYAAVDMNTLPHGGRPDRPSPDETTGLQIIELLLEKGANPNLQLKLLPPYRSVGADRGVDTMLTIGATPLLRAAKAMDAPAIRLLLTYGA
ncbi:MAG TPA: ankyrin repeat domain-containing protein, partial [Terriglobia bacterium]|nr:ankyrin repeat domain-containing protein [Terriglobia bacterium]